MDLLTAARRFTSHRTYLFFLHQGHFLDPLVPGEWEVLSRQEVAGDPAVLRVAGELLPARLDRLAPGIYFPVPIARALDRGVALAAALESYHYELLKVDRQQRWWWKGQQVAPRIRQFFTEHLAYQPALDLYYFEYRVNPGWWDKCYLEAEITPLVADRLEERDGALQVRLNMGVWVPIDPGSLHLDDEERLLCRSPTHGQVLFSDWLRFSVLRGVSDDATSIRWGERSLPLGWPEGRVP